VLCSEQGRHGADRREGNWKLRMWEEEANEETKGLLGLKNALLIQVNTDSL
jgi:hypothetical protein